VVRTVVRRLKDPLQCSGSALSLDLEEDVVGHWDRAWLERVMTELLTNAITYGAGRPIELRVFTDGEQARLVVRDHGIGIAPEAQSRVFQCFERAVSLRHFGGLGLGLYLVRRAVDALGGVVECVSTPGQGSTFTVSLPGAMNHGAGSAP
jgi:signal transduction histidine kinase